MLTAGLQRLHSDLTLVFTLPPAMARQLPQQLALVSLNPAHPRPRAVTIVGYDSTDRVLADAGLALSHSGRRWRLERSRPGAEPWPPAGPEQILAEAGDLKQLGRPLPENLDETSRFVGRATELTSDAGFNGLTVRIVTGTIRRGRTRHPFAQVVLSGSEAAVAGLAHGLAETVPLLPPRASLAGEMDALVTGTTPVAKRIGTVALTGNLKVGEAFPQVIAHLTDVMLFWARAISRKVEDPEPVHQMRVALRRMRSAISIFGDACASPAVLSVGARMRDLGSILGPARDWDVFLTRLGKRVGTALPAEPGLIRLLQVAQRHRDQAYRSLVSHLEGSEFRQLCIDLSVMAVGNGWRDGRTEKQLAVLDMPLRDFAVDLLERRHRRVKRRGRHFKELDTPALHKLRLAGKRLRYAAEFFAPLFAIRPATQFIDRLIQLQDQLGHLTDGAVANALLEQLGAVGGRHSYAIGLVRGFVASDMSHNRQFLERDWKRFRKLDPFWT